jgi:CRP-like cAMP-binding protein
LAESLAQGHRNNRLLAALPLATLTQMGSDLRQISIAQGVVIYEPGDAVEEVYFPHTGLISLLVVTKDGGSIETSTVGREGAVGLQGGLGPRRAFTRATTQIGGSFSTIHAKRFEQIALDSGELRALIGSYTEVLWAEAQQVAACNAAHDAASRLARWLLQCADRIGSDKLPLTQEFLAQMLSVRRTTVTLLAQALQRKGLIKYSRGQIIIVDRNALEREACECFHVLHYDKLPQTIGVELLNERTH